MTARRAIGLMSGTSLDGLDICFAEFRQAERWNFNIIAAETIPYGMPMRENLQSTMNLQSDDLLAFSAEYGFYLGDCVNRFIEKYRITDVDLIASHGHTVFHQPHRRMTCQIGDGRAIRLRTGIATVYDFRMQDVLLNGNGAPLVPIGDENLFPEYDACLNIGGFANISLKRGGKRIAFDICPVNIILNEIAKRLGKDFDRNGDIAKGVFPDFNLLRKLNELDFYREAAPKSLGKEWSDATVKMGDGLPPDILLATFTEHAAVQIADILRQYDIKEVLVTGGGAYNEHLIRSISKKTSVKVVLPDAEIINFKEALVFAFMGILRMRGENNVLASATGAERNHSSGIIV